MRVKDIPLPHRWPHLVRQAMIHAASLAHCDILYAWSKAENSSEPTAWLKGQIDKLQTELAQSQNQNRILKARFERIPAQRLPNYFPTERMEIIAHKSACGWNLAANTIGRYLKSEDPIKPDDLDASEEEPESKSIPAK